jgi:hypothetical protein
MPDEVSMKTRHPTDSGFDEAPEVCPICARDLDDDGTCAACGGLTDWRKTAEDRRAEYAHDSQHDEL